MYYAEIGPLTGYLFYTIQKHSGRTTIGLQKYIARFLGGGGRSVPAVYTTCPGPGYLRCTAQTSVSGHWQISGCVAVLSNGGHEFY
jgi:hypothetical protein